MWPMVPGARVQLVLPTGAREAGEEGAVLEVAQALALVRFDRADSFGVHTTLVQTLLLRPLDPRAR